MTIKIEREALQCITNDTSPCSLPPLERQQVDHIPESSYKDDSSYPELDLTVCDDDSSVSSYSFSSSTTERSVSWSTPLVVEVRTRPRTKPRHVSRLFYSYEETQRFRHEYRLERRRAAEEDAAASSGSLNGTQETTVDHDSNPSSSSKSFTHDDCGTLSTDATNSDSSNFLENTSSNGSKGPGGKHRISRVVIVHKNKRQTFVDHEAPTNLNDKLDSFISDRTSIIPSVNDSIDPEAAKNFFDNDNFWSGEITWY